MNEKKKTENGIYIGDKKIAGLEEFEFNITDKVKYICPDIYEVRGSMTVEYKEKYLCKNCGRHTDSIFDFAEDRYKLITIDGLCSECSERKAIINQRLQDVIWEDKDE